MLQQSSVTAQPAQQQVATKQTKSRHVTPFHTQNTTPIHQAQLPPPLNCPTLACALNRLLPTITTRHYYSKRLLYFLRAILAANVDVDGFRVRAQGWTDGWNQNEQIQQKSTAMGH